MNTIATLIAGLAIFWGSTRIQDSPEIPNIVQHAFTKNFDVPSEVAWKKTNSGYEVAFNLADVAHAARYTADGELLMVKMALNDRDLPPVIRQRITDDFREFAIAGIAQVKTGDRVLFQIALDGPSEDRKVVFNAEGDIEQKFPYWN